MYNVSDLISIAMATYNGERYIAEQLNSIINQTHKNIEIIITDDGSKDQTINIIEAYIKKYAFIKLYKNPVNVGITKTFENSLFHCKGKYIALSDQDDIWEKNKLEILAGSIDSEDAVYANSLFVDESCNSLNRSFKNLMNLKSYYSGTPFLLGTCLPGHSMLIKYDFLQTLFPFPENLMFDCWINFRAAANNGIKYVDKILVYYRQHQNNAIGISQPSRKKVAIQLSRFDRKLNQLTVYAGSSFSDKKTKVTLTRMLALFNKRWSIQRSLFFFKNFNAVLAFKKRSTLKKIFYCIKMIFKANY